LRTPRRCELAAALHRFTFRVHTSRDAARSSIVDDNESAGPCGFMKVRNIPWQRGADPGIA
jgi:hypothetical protein